MGSVRYVPLPILATVLAPAIVLLAVGLWAPWGLAAGVGLSVAITLAGALWVAAESRERRSGAPGSDSWGRWGPAIVVGAAIGVLATALGAPGIFVKDAGELAASALSLGVAHPTGFPAFCLAGRALGFLPMGSLAFRMNLLSMGSLGVAGALAAATVIAIAHGGDSVGPRDRRIVAIAAMLAAATLVVSPTTWLHGTTVEVYLPSLAGFGAVAFCVAMAGCRRDARWWIAGAFLAGLGAGGHVTWPLWGVLLIAGGLAGAAWRREVRWPVVPAMIVAGMIGALVLIYLPVRAARDPVMDWGHPADLPGLLAHLTGARIRSSFQAFLGSMTPATMGLNALEVLRHLLEGTGPMIPLAIAGFAVDPRRSGAFRWALAAVVLGDVWFAVGVNPMGIRDLQVNPPATWALAVLGGDGLLRVMERLTLVGRSRAARALAFGGAGVLGAMALVAPADRDLRHLHAPRDVVEELGVRLPVGASLWTTTDDLSATVAAMQVLEGLRPDVLALVRQHLGDTRAVARRLAARGGRPGEGPFRTALQQAPFEAGGEAPGEALERAVAALRSRGAVFMEPGEGWIDEGWNGRFWPGFPVFEVREETGVALSREAVMDASRRALAHVPSADRWTRSFLASCLRSLGNLLARRGVDEWAILRYGEALAVDPSDVRAMHNLAVLWESRGRTAEALRWARMAVQEDPAYARGWRTLARLAHAAGEVQEASRARSWSRALTGGDGDR